MWFESKRNGNGTDYTSAGSAQANPRQPLDLQRNMNNTLIDNLSYSNYDNGNRLKSVNDASGNTAGYAPNTGQYLYDANANMTYDPSKKITVSYNHLNLPSLVEFDNSDFIEYTYTATGTKLRKTVTSWKTTAGGTTDYSGQFLYQDNELSCIFTPVGRIVPMQYNDETFWKHEYNLKDHLGNTRIVFAAHQHGQPEVMQQTSYYPFGMTLQQQNFGGALNPPNKLLYNGKELQDDELAGVSLDWYDYGARMYDAQIGKFPTPDQLTEKYPWITPYSYCLNNPTNSIDPDGREPFTLAILARMGIGAAIGAGIDVTVQMTANMTLGNQNFWDAASSIDWTSVGASAATGAVGVPGTNVISNTLKVATIATAVTADAAVDVSIAEGNQNVFNGKKSLTTAAIDAAGSIIGGKASDDIIKGAKNSISNDISSGAFSTLNNAEKSTLRQAQSVVNSQGFEAGIKTAVGLGTEAGKTGVKSVIGTGINPVAAVPLMHYYTPSADNTFNFIYRSRDIDPSQGGFY